MASHSTLRPRVNATQWNSCPLGNPSLGAPLSVSSHPIIFRVPITALPQCLYLRRPFPQYTDPPPFRTTSSMTTDIPGADPISRRPRSHRAWRTLRNAVPSPRVARTQRTHSSVVRVLRFRHLVRNLPACPRICSTARSQELFCGESVPLFLGVGSGLCFQWAGTLHLNARS